MEWLPLELLSKVASLKDTSRFVVDLGVQLRPWADFPSASSVKCRYPLEAGPSVLCLAAQWPAPADTSRSEAAAATTSLAPAHRPSTTRPSEVCDCDCVLVIALATARSGTANFHRRYY